MTTLTRREHLVLALILLCLPLSRVAAGQQETGFVDRSITHAGVDYPYQVYLPADYAARDAWPVILFLHGAGERGADGLAQTEVGLGSALRRDPSMYPAIVVFPQAPEGGWWPVEPAEAAVAALDEVLADFGTDADRVYLTGLSMGGNGSWYVAYEYAEKFAAVVPICGWIARPEEAPDWIEAADGTAAIARVAERLRDMPIWAFHGETDGVVPVAGSRLIVDALRELGSDVRYTELPGTGHNVWDPAYRSPGLAAWLLEQTRQ